MCLPTNWTGTCSPIYLAPNINIDPPDQSLPVSSTQHVKQKRAIQVIPLLAALGITTSLGLGTGGLATSLTYSEAFIH